MKKNKIPKVIHYCWFGENEKNDLVKKCINSWKEKCPDYEIIEWNEKNFDYKTNEFAQEAYQHGKWAFVADYARLKIVYEKGGIYLDTDVELLKNLDMFLNCNGFFSTEDGITVSTGLGFGAQKDNPIVKKMLDDYSDEKFVLSNGKFNDEACPIKNSRSIKRILDSFVDRNNVCEYDDNYFYPKEYFCPLDNMTGKLTITDNTVAIHHYSGSWLDKKEMRIKKNRRTITRIFGKKIGRIICSIYTLPYRVSKKVKIYGIRGTTKMTINKFLKK